MSRLSSKVNALCLHDWRSPSGFVTDETLHRASFPPLWNEPKKYHLVVEESSWEDADLCFALDETYSDRKNVNWTRPVHSIESFPLVAKVQ